MLHTGRSEFLAFLLILLAQAAVQADAGSPGSGPEPLPVRYYPSGNETVDEEILSGPLSGGLLLPVAGGPGLEEWIDTKAPDVLAALGAEFSEAETSLGTPDRVRFWFMLHGGHSQTSEWWSMTEIWTEHLDAWLRERLASSGLARMVEDRSGTMLLQPFVPAGALFHLVRGLDHDALYRQVGVREKVYLASLVRGLPGEPGSLVAARGLAGVDTELALRVLVPVVADTHGLAALVSLRAMYAGWSLDYRPGVAVEYLQPFDGGGRSLSVTVEGETSWNRGVFSVEPGAGFGLMESLEHGTLTHVRSEVRAGFDWLLSDTLSVGLETGFYLGFPLEAGRKRLVGAVAGVVLGMLW